MTSLSERIEAAARALVKKSGYANMLALPKARRLAVKEDCETVIRAAFPELFTSPPTHWLAPMEADKVMIDVGEDKIEEFKDSDWDSGGDGESSFSAPGM